MTAMTSKILAGVAALTVLALPAVGDAQSTSRSMASNQPIAFGADSGEQTAERITLVEDMSALLDLSTDRFLLLRLDPRSRVHTLGKAVQPADPDYFYVG